MIVLVPIPLDDPNMVPAVMPGMEQEWIDQAAAAFDGEVVLGTDLAVIDA